MDAERVPNVLSIAGSDPTGGAGIQLDLQVFSCHGVHGMAVPTALTVQSTKGIQRVLPAFPNTVGEQLATLLGDIRPDAIKLGMLATDDVLLRIAHLLDGYNGPRVVDPVLRASDGSFLLERRAWPNLTKRIIAGATLVTPNLAEAEALTGTSDPEEAARSMRDFGAKAVLVTGGHASGEPDDFLLSDAGGQWLRGTRQAADSVHGTGCALSSAIAARLARGEALPAAVERAKVFVERAIARAHAAGSGARMLRLEPVSD